MKKVISILLLVVALVMFMVGCGSTQSDTMNSAPETDVAAEPATQLEPTSAHESETTSVPEVKTANFKFALDRQGTYNKPGFGEKYGVFRFEGTNVVVFNLSTNHGGFDYLIGEDTGETQGPSIGYDILCGGHFLALSSKYMLFLTEDGKIAIDLVERREEREDGNFLVHDKIPFLELPVEEQEAFVYPSSYEEFSNIE